MDVEMNGNRSEMKTPSGRKLRFALLGCSALLVAGAISTFVFLSAYRARVDQDYFARFVNGFMYYYKRDHGSWPTTLEGIEDELRATKSIDSVEGIVYREQDPRLVINRITPVGVDATLIFSGGRRIDFQVPDPLVRDRQVEEWVQELRRRER